MTHKIIRALWGDLEGPELKKFSLLALGFFFLVGSWWPLKTLKDSIFINIVGPLHLPEVKIASLLIFFPLMFFYSKLVDKFSKEKLIYFFIFVYGFFGFIFVYFLLHPTIGLTNLETNPFRILGWAFYLYCESFISLMLNLYWSFINDITTTESAKKGYGLIIFGTQFGGLLFTILGTYLSYDPSKYAQKAPIIALISIVMFFMIALIVFLLQYVVSKDNLQGYKPEKKTENIEISVGFFDGLKLIIKKPYLTGIFLIIFLQELISTMMGFQLSLLVKNTYQDPGLVNKFLFDFALCVQAMACFFGLVGTSFFQRRLGIKFSLIAYPLSIALFIVCYMIQPTLQTIFYVMLVAKALGYALNQPTKEVLYIPTSKNIKYKSKAWIDMFGLRFAKASGSIINRILGPVIILTGSCSLGLIVLWICIANAVSNIFKKTVEKKELIE